MKNLKCSKYFLSNHSRGGDDDDDDADDKPESGGGAEVKDDLTPSQEVLAPPLIEEGESLAYEMVRHTYVNTFNKDGIRCPIFELQEHIVLLSKKKLLDR